MFKRSDEPLYWTLFGAGGVLVALALPALVLITGLAWPLGLLPAESLGYERLSGLLRSPIGALAMLAVVFLSLWHAAHRIFHSLHDFGVHANMGRWKALSYGAAAFGGAWAALMLIVLQF
jgi:fumarate reductase subunit D